MWSASYEVQDGTPLVADLERGSIEVRGEAGRDRIDVTATLRAWGSSMDAAREYLAGVDLSGEHTDEGVRLDVSRSNDREGEHVSVALVVRVPAATPLAVIGADVDVAIYAVSSAMDVTTGASATVRGGDIERLTIEAGGDIDIAGRLARGAEHAARSTGGDVHLRIPADSRLQIEAEASRRGSIASALPLFGDTEGTAWSATLNAPDGLLRLRADTGRILIGRLHET